MSSSHTYQFFKYSRITNHHRVLSFDTSFSFFSLPESLSRDLQRMVCSCALPSDCDFEIIFYSCVVVLVISNSKKNGSLFSRAVGEWFDLSTRNAKTAEIQSRKRKFPLMYLGRKRIG